MGEYIKEYMKKKYNVDVEPKLEMPKSDDMHERRLEMRRQLAVLDKTL